MDDLIINGVNVANLLKEKYEKLKQDWVTLLQVPVEKSMLANIEAIKVLQSMGYKGIYITLSKDYISLAEMFKNNGIDLDQLTFIDGISQMYGIKEVSAPNVVYVEGPLSTDAITESIVKISPTIKEDKKFVFLDSITTVLLYNSLERTMKFSQFFSETLKKLSLVGIVVSVSKGVTNEELINELEKLADEVVDLNDKSE